jgi:enediyne biosynthesis protein E4
LSWSRRSFLTSLSTTALVLTLDDVLALGVQQNPQSPQLGSRPTYNAVPRPAPKGPPSPVAGTPLGISFIDVARQCGLNAKTVYGGEHKNKYLLETTGCGVAFFDYDQDDWIDIFLVNGTRLEGFPKGQEPLSHLFKNNRDGTFTDVTAKAGLGRAGWGQGCCVGDYNNDGWNDLFVSYYGQNVLYRNNGDGTFTDVTEKAGLVRHGWGQGVCVGDYDNDGNLDLFVTYYGKNVLYHNNGNGTFTDATRESGLLESESHWNTGAAFIDYNRDGHLDLFVSNYVAYEHGLTLYESNPALVGQQSPILYGVAGLKGTSGFLYRNNGNGTFTDVSRAAGITKAEPT